MHETLDTRISDLDLSARQGYRMFLSMQAIAQPGVEHILQRSDFASVCPGWRSRAPVLATSLKAMDLPQPTAELPELVLNPWGVAYVLEGSRLGAQVLAKRVASGETGGDPDALAFLAKPPALRWPQFLVRLEAALVNNAQRTAAVQAAIWTFGHYMSALETVRASNPER